MRKASVCVLALTSASAETATTPGRRRKRTSGLVSELKHYKAYLAWLFFPDGTSCASWIA
jgi:hypothetical protein